MSKYFVDVMVTVEVTVNDDSVIRRVVDNEDNWRGTFYDMRTRDDVLYHLAFNCINNGADQAVRLDGWADLAGDAATMRVVDVYHEGIVAP